MIDLSGAWSFKAYVSFEGEVNGKSGTLKMYAAGSRPDVFTDWSGSWKILSGTGDLSDLRGRGPWWGPGAPGVGQWGDIYYSGEIQFGSK